MKFIILIRINGWETEIISMKGCSINTIWGICKETRFEELSLANLHQINRKKQHVTVTFRYWGRKPEKVKCLKSIALNRYTNNCYVTRIKDLKYIPEILERSEFAYHIFWQKHPIYRRFLKYFLLHTYIYASKIRFR